MDQMHSSGTYALIMENESCSNIWIGKRGILQLNPGFYIYTGSAFGPGGVHARASHHIKVHRSPHWHIDYLRRHAGLAEIWYCFDIKKREHQWADLLERQKGNTVPMPGFGSSDCRCATHLLFNRERPVFSEFKTLIRAQIPNHFEIYRWHSIDPLSPKIAA